MSPSTEDKSAEAVIEGDHIVIRVRIDVLQTALKWVLEKEGLWPMATITDELGFAKEVVSELNYEDEEGTTPIHMLFDDAMLDAIEHGSQHVLLPEEAEKDLN